MVVEEMNGGVRQAMLMCVGVGGHACFMKIFVHSKDQHSHKHNCCLLEIIIRIFLLIGLQAKPLCTCLCYVTHLYVVMKFQKKNYECQLEKYSNFHQAKISTPKAFHSFIINSSVGWKVRFKFFNKLKEKCLSPRSALCVSTTRRKFH